MHWSIRSVQSGAGNKLQHDATCIVLRLRWPNGALSADVVMVGAGGSLALELGNLSAINGSWVFRSD